MKYLIRVCLLPLWIVLWLLFTIIAILVFSVLYVMGDEDLNDYKHMLFKRGMKIKN